MAGKSTKSVPERFWPKVSIRSDDDCWPWLAATDGRGRYGLFYLEGRLVGAHRMSYELVKGPIPAELVIDHICRNTICVNPVHLDAVTPHENVVVRSTLTPSGVNWRKAACKNGHSFTRANTRIDTRGSRVCRTCDNAKDRLRHAAAKEHAHAA